MARPRVELFCVSPGDVAGETCCGVMSSLSCCSTSSSFALYSVTYNDTFQIELVKKKNLI